MKYIKHLVFTFVVLLGFTITASAQRNDQRRPPKGNPPVVTPADKDRPRDNPPKNNGGGKDNRGKGRGNRPGLAALVPGNQIVLELF